MLEWWFLELTVGKFTLPAADARIEEACAAADPVADARADCAAAIDAEAEAYCSSIAMCIIITMQL